MKLHIAPLVLTAMIVSAATSHSAFAAPGGNGNGNGNAYGYGYGNGRGGGGGGAGGGPLPLLGATLLGQAAGLGGLFMLWRRKRLKAKQQKGNAELEQHGAL